jgi:integrase
MASVYKRGNQYWVAYYVNGRREQKSLHTSNLRVARDKKRKVEYELAIGDLDQASRLPLVPVLEAFCKHLQATRTYKSYKNDFSRLRTFFGPVCEALKPLPPGPQRDQDRAKPRNDKFAHAHVKVKLLEDLSPAMINRFLSARVEHDRWSPKTVNLTRQVLHRFFSYAIKHHGFRSRDRRFPNPVKAVERRREPAPEIRFLSLKQIAEQLAAVTHHPVIHAIVATLIYAGLRREEALWLTHEDVDLKARMIRVRAKTVGHESWQPKTKRNRTVPVSDALLEILQAYEPPAYSGWFFPSPLGKRWNTDNFSADLRTINVAKNLPWTSLDFRHTFGSHLAQKGESLYKIATLMGNSPDICRRHYAALIPEAMHDSVEFEPVGRDEQGRDDTRELLEQILKEVSKKSEDQSGKPRLRVVHS